MLRPQQQETASGDRPGIRLDRVARRFGGRWILRGIDLTVDPGTVIALTGRNGSGKTTLLRIIASLLRPTRGAVAVYGNDTVRDTDRVRALVGLLGHNSGLYPQLTAAENLAFSMRMSGRTPDRDAILGVLDRAGLRASADTVTQGFSAGMARRLGIARLLLRPPHVLLLDEPYASFDEDGIRLVNELATSTGRAGGIVILATHDVDRAQGVANRRIHLEDGLIGDGTGGPIDAMDVSGTQAPDAATHAQAVIR